MAGSRRRRRMQRQRHRADAGAPSGLPPKPPPDAAAQDPSATSLADLPPELLAEIQSLLDFVDRLNFTAGCGGAVASSCQRHRPEAPCLVLPGATAETATLFSLCDDGHHQAAAAARAPDPAMRGHVVLKGSKEVKPEYWRHPREKVTAPVFEVQVLDEARRRWAAARDIRDLALFVGVNASMCVSAREHPGIRAGCVYYTEDELGQASLRLETEPDGCRTLYRSSVGADRHGYELRDLGVYVLKDGTVERVEGLGKHRCWPPPAWFTPSV